MRSTAPLRAPEVKLAHAGALGAALAAAPVAVIAAALDGVTAALTAAGGAALVGLLALAVTPLYRMGVKAGNDAIIAVHMAALGARLMLALGVLVVLSRQSAIDMTAVALGIAAGLVASIAAEMVTASRDPRFFWVTAAAGGPTTTSATSEHSGTERQCT